MTLFEMEQSIRMQREFNNVGDFQTYGRVCVFYRAEDDSFEVTRLNGNYVGFTRDYRDAARMAFDVVSR